GVGGRVSRSREVGPPAAGVGGGGEAGASGRGGGGGGRRLRGPGGRGADAAVMAGRLAQPARTTTLISSDTRIPFRQRLAMIPPFFARATRAVGLLGAAGGPIVSRQPR